MYMVQLNNKNELLVFFLGAVCIGIFIRSFRTTNYFFFNNIHFHNLFSHSLKFLGRGRLHDLLAQDEGLVARARDALENDGKGDSGPWRISFNSSSARSRHLAPILHNTRDCPTINNRVKRRSKYKENLTKSGLPEALQARRDSFIIDSIFRYV